MNTRKITRRKAGQLLLGAPVIAATAATALLAPRPARAAEDAPAAPPEPSPLANFMAKQEDGLGAEQQAKLRKEVTGLEEALTTLREFKLSNDVPPAGSFRALRSPRSGGRS